MRLSTMKESYPHTRGGARRVLTIVVNWESTNLECSIVYVGGYVGGLLHSRTKRVLDPISEVQAAVGFVEEILFTLVAGILSGRNPSHSPR
jgi:hypothetical protein